MENYGKDPKRSWYQTKIGTHGCRKTMVNRHIKLSDDKTEGLIEMQGYLNHSSARITLGYACVTQEKNTANERQNGIFTLMVD